MEETATIDAGTAPEAQSTDTEAAAPQAAEAQANAGAPDVKELLQREKDDPNVVFTDSELDALEKHWATDGKKRTKAAEPKAEPEDEEADEPAPEPKAKPEKEEEADEAEAEPDEGEDPDIKALLKEVGAKSLKEVPQKIKDLRKLVGGKDAQAVTRITKERDEIVNQGKALWSALAKGDAHAIAFAEKTFGVKFASPAKAEPAPDANGFIDPENALDPDSAKVYNSALKQALDKIKALEDKFGTIEEERDRHIQATVKDKSMAAVIDEMAEIADKIPSLKGLPGFREVAKGVLSDKPDARLDVFQELFDIAKDEGCSLKAAFLIKRGRDSDRIEAEAIQKGLKQAYNQKPNPSLSGMTGNKGEASYQRVTEADLERWESDHRTHPAHWYDKDDNPVKSKIPKAAWKIFDFK